MRQRTSMMPRTHAPALMLAAAMTASVVMIPQQASTALASQVSKDDMLAGLRLSVGGIEMGDFDRAREGYAKDFGLLDAPRPMTVTLSGLPEGWVSSVRMSSRTEEAGDAIAYLATGTAKVTAPDGSLAREYALDLRYSLPRAVREACSDPGTGAVLDSATLFFRDEEIPGFAPGQPEYTVGCGVGQGLGDIELRGLPEGWHVEIVESSGSLGEPEVDEQGNRFMQRRMLYSFRATSDDLLWSTGTFKLIANEAKAPMPAEGLTAPDEVAHPVAEQLFGDESRSSGKGSLAQTGAIRIDDSVACILAVIAAGSLAVTVFAWHKSRNDA